MIAPNASTMRLIIQSIIVIAVPIVGIMYILGIFHGMTYRIPEIAYDVGSCTDRGNASSVGSQQEFYSELNFSFDASIGVPDARFGMSKSSVSNGMHIRPNNGVCKDLTLRVNKSVGVKETRTTLVGKGIETNGKLIRENDGKELVTYRYAQNSPDREVGWESVRAVWKKERVAFTRIDHSTWLFSILINNRASDGASYEESEEGLPGKLSGQAVRIFVPARFRVHNSSARPSTHSITQIYADSSSSNAQVVVRWDSVERKQHISIEVSDPRLEKQARILLVVMSTVLGLCLSLIVDMWRVRSRS